MSKSSTKSPSVEQNEPDGATDPPKRTSSSKDVREKRTKKEPETSSRQSKRGSGDEEESALTPEDIEAIKNMKISERFDKLDRDYFLYLSLIHSAMKTTQISPKEIEIAWAWIQKIISMQSSSVETKREKNIYFLYLLLQLRDNHLKGIFSRKPAQGSLNKAAEAFYGAKPEATDKYYENKFLEPDATMAHKSGDGRTYVATKVLDQNAGVCCYVAVSSGLNDPIWITPCGDQAEVPAREDLPVNVIRKYGDSVYFEKKKKQEGKADIENKRKSIDERLQLTSFHEEVVNRINEEMRRLLCEKSNYIKDPVVLNLIRKLKSDALYCGECINESPMDLLRRLRDKSIREINDAQEREREIEMLSDNLNGEDLNHKLVDLSANLAMDPEDDVWLAAIQEEPEVGVISALKKVYPDCVIEALLTLLERQRQIAIDQEKRNFEELIFTLKSELEENVQSWRKEHEELREEWGNVLKVLRDIEKARLELDQENEVVETPLDAKKQSVAYRQLDDAMQAYQSAREFYLSTERKTASLQCKIQEAQRGYLESKKDLEMETSNWSATICRLKKEIQMQEMLIKDLQGHM